MKPVCRCRAYPFPHRKFSGSCLANEQGPFCGSCGQPCDVHWVTEEEPYEFWGQRGFQKTEYAESDCCSEAVYEDPGLTRELTN